MSSGRLDPLEGLAEDELAGMEDEGLLVGDGDELGQVLHPLADVDVGVAGVVEDAELPIDADVDARRLDQIRVVGVEGDPAGVDLLADRAVAEHHRGGSLCKGAVRGGWTNVQTR